MTIPLIISSPIQFEFDPDTGLLHMRAEASFVIPGGGTKLMGVEMMLQEPSIRALLDDLPALKILLEKASEGRTTPDFLQ